MPRTARTAPGWSTIEQMEQARWLRFANEHAHEHTLCDLVVAAGVVTQDRAAQLARLAAEKNWPIPSVGQAAARRRHKRR